MKSLKRFFKELLIAFGELHRELCFALKLKKRVDLSDQYEKLSDEVLEIAKEWLKITNEIAIMEYLIKRMGPNNVKISTKRGLKSRSNMKLINTERLN